MCSFIYRGNRLLPRIFVSLCMLSILVIFTPQLSQSNRSTGAPISISPNYQDYALLPIPFRINDHLREAKRIQSDIYRRAVSIEDTLVSFCPPWYFTSYLCSIPNYVGSSESISQRGFRHACQLLNIPPPIYSFSTNWKFTNHREVCEDVLEKEAGRGTAKS